MTATLSVVDDAAGVELDGSRLRYVDEDGMQHRLSLADAWAVRFEAMSPARRYGARTGQRHPGSAAMPDSIASTAARAHTTG